MTKVVLMVFSKINQLKSKVRLRTIFKGNSRLNVIAGQTDRQAWFQKPF